ncbi:GH92 family glycosyl hydrolase [Myxococcota bacterium]|nr:GH92 family glycosyl hydrolase [Myxococcota bacterium]
MILLFVSFACGEPEVAPEPKTPVDLVSLVRPHMGSGGLGYGYGGLTPAAETPNGFVKVGPDTRTGSSRLSFNHSAGYCYDDTHIQAFSHTRLPGIGVSDGGAVGFMLSDIETIDPDAYQRPFSHDDEVARPGYYAVTLPGLGAVELAATPRAAAHRWTWEGESRWLTLDLGHTTSSSHGVYDTWIALHDDQQTITGFVEIEGSLSSRGGRGLPVWFVAKLSAPWVESQAWLDGAPAEDPSAAAGARAAATLRFDVPEVQVRIGLSAVDLAGAEANLAAELPDFDLPGAATAAEALWREAFAPFTVTGGSEADQILFATALYNTRRMPTLFSDVDGRYRGVDDTIHDADGFLYYTDFSLWDTYRTLHPLVILAWPDLARDFARSLSQMGIANGYLPRWPAGAVESGTMVGTPAEIVLAETALKGISGFGEAEIWPIAAARALDPDSPFAREGLRSTQTLGYIPYEERGASVSILLEHATSDHAMSLWATSLGLNKEAETLMAQSKVYDAVFDAESQFVRGRLADGAWAPLEDEVWGEAFSEGNAWQYTWMLPQDPAALAAAFGGEAAAVTKLNELFELSEGEADTIGPDVYYWHGNEPDLCFAPLFTLLGEPELSQDWVRWIQDNKYSSEHDGLDGNDDGGTLSAWWLFTAMGLYPLNGTVDYVLLTPRFDEVRIQREGLDLTLTATGEGHRIDGVSLDGVAVEGLVVSHEQLTGGSELVFSRL